MKNKLKFSWSNWGFGAEELSATADRLKKYGIHYIELHGNLYGEDIGYRVDDVQEILQDNNLEVSGVCGMFSVTSDLSSIVPLYQQNAISYLKRNVQFASAVGAHYILVVPAAVGRPDAYDAFEEYRSVVALNRVADIFLQYSVPAAVEPIRSAEVSIVHTFDAAREYIRRVNHPGVQHINGDVYHMLAEETHIASSILSSGDLLLNLHLADSNRRALGEGMLDIDTIIMALYLIGYNNRNCFCTAEPLGPGGDPYPAMYGMPDASAMDSLVKKTVETWTECEDRIRAL